ncbi:ATP-binding protein [Sphaerisporangium sp. B11E5]|uniref:ATP-binding protein n=1 Tax=Sphaerisporangium sp. B11E5 TaxID=3153563 RepID=UPI00325C55BA
MPPIPTGLRAAVLEIPHDPAAISGARTQVKEVLSAWGLAELTDDVVLVVGELLGNAVCHGAPPVRVSLWATPRDFCVRVTDRGPEMPRRLHLGPEAVHGRGLAIVAALADECGVIPLPGQTGKTVWARWKRIFVHSVHTVET